MRASVVTAAVLVLLAAPATAQDTYRIPPPEVAAILDAPPIPIADVSPDGEWMVLGHRESMPSVGALAEPMLRLAGRRINPRTNGLHGPPPIVRFEIVDVDSGDGGPIEGAEGGLGLPMWAPDGDSFAFTQTTDAGIRLWVADAESGAARAVTEPVLNGARGEPCAWTSGGARLLCHATVSGRGQAPVRPRVPTGPVVQESSNTATPAWTFQDLLGDEHSEALYEFYMTSQPVLVDPASGTSTEIGEPGIYESLDPSPSGDFFLSVRTVRPYSYLVPDARFPKVVEVLGPAGDVVQGVASLPLDEGGPEHMGFRRAGAREFSWRAGHPATLVYVEALDGGDPAKDIPHRDRVVMLPAPFTDAPTELIRTQLRLGSGPFGFGYPVLWGEDGRTALVSEFDWPTRKARTWVVDADRPVDGPRVLFDRSTDDWYGNPGEPVMTVDRTGDAVVKQDGDRIFLAGPGGSPEGDRPFLDRLDLGSGETERLFRSDADSYEVVTSILDDEGERVITRRETATDPPNYYVVRPGRDGRAALTSFPHPQPQLAGIKKEKIFYERADGIPLSGELYLPADHEPGQRLPVLVWAYPREYADTDGAGQVRGSANRFTSVSGASHLLFATQGYAVLDDAAMPIVGGFTANDSYVDQLVANGKAAVDKLVEMGVADRDRVGIAGHSYGAFMTANMLAHSDDFAAGIARSGAFNRSLTPFGFQYERRSFWDAPEVYYSMSAFMHADDVNEPLLLIHGMIDNNSGTFPVQSERMYHAVKGLGGTVRLVMLPYESHGYRGRESVLHTVWEMLEWMDRYVKNRSARAVSP